MCGDTVKSLLLHSLRMVKSAELDFVPDYEVATPQTTRPIRGAGSTAGSQIVSDSAPPPNLGREVANQARSLAHEVRQSVAPVERAVRGVASEVPGVLRDLRSSTQPSVEEASRAGSRLYRQSSRGVSEALEGSGLVHPAYRPNLRGDSTISAHDQEIVDANEIMRGRLRHMIDTMNSQRTQVRER